MLQESAAAAESWSITAPTARSPSALGLEALMNGSLEIAAFNRQNSRFVVCLWQRADDSRVELAEREQRILTSLLMGRSQKQIGYDFDISPSTVSGIIRQMLKKIGADCWEQLVTVACALDAANRGDDAAPALTSSDGLQISTTARPRVLSLLTPAEREVALYVVGGCSNVQIGELRRTSARTVANQISSLFRKLEVRGRLELILRLFDGWREAVS
ncbi:MAG TPA: LuxR C-terminal-related transcriptional regulator [Polyangiaceae bacterium]|nr:LuxR C-terminal-related transcriptional regulator [Polyangiaceae bacterium]